MRIRTFTRRAGLAATLAVASLLVVPMATAHVHIGIGIAIPGVTIGAGNCWRCGYFAVPPPVYYQPVYPVPRYYPAPVYYGHGYYAPRYYPRYYRHHAPRFYRHRNGYRGRYYHHRGSRGYRGGYGYYHRGHR